MHPKFVDCECKKAEGLAKGLKSVGLHLGGSPFARAGGPALEQSSATDFRDMAKQGCDSSSWERWERF